MITPRHGFAVAQVGKTIYAVSGVNNAGGAGTLSVVPVNEIYEPSASIAALRGRASARRHNPPAIPPSAA